MSGMGPMPPPFRWSIALSSWHLAWLPSALLLIVLVAYLLGARRSPDWPLGRSVAMVLACVVTFLGVESVLGVYDMVLFADHMVQHLVLIMLAAPLFALAAPLDLARQASPAPVRAALTRFLDGPVGAVLLHPLVGFGLYAVFIPVTHLSSLMNFAMGHLWAHHLEQIAFLVVGYLFFRSVFGIEASPHPLHPGFALIYLMAAVPVDTITGLALAMSSHNPYPVYDAMNRPWGPSVLADVHLGGAIMWIGGDGLMLLALIPAAVRWVRYEDRRTREIDAELDRAGAD